MADDFLLWGLLVLEVANWLLLVALHWRLQRLAKAWVGKVIRALNLAPGGPGNPTLRAKLTGGRSDEEEEPEVGEGADALIASVADRLGVEPEKLAGLARQYLGSNALGPGGRPGQAGKGPPGLGRQGPDPLGLFLQKVLAGQASEEEIQMGLPLALGWLRQNWNQGGRGSGGPGPATGPGSNW